MRLDHLVRVRPRARKRSSHSDGVKGSPTVRRRRRRRSAGSTATASRTSRWIVEEHHPAGTARRTTVAVDCEARAAAGARDRAPGGPGLAAFGHLVVAHDHDVAGLLADVRVGTEGLDAEVVAHGLPARKLGLLEAHGRDLVEMQPAIAGHRKTVSGQLAAGRRSVSYSRAANRPAGCSRSLRPRPPSPAAGRRAVAAATRSRSVRACRAQRSERQVRGGEALPGENRPSVGEHSPISSKHAVHILDRRRAVSDRRRGNAGSCDRSPIPTVKARDSPAARPPRPGPHLRAASAATDWYIHSRPSGPSPSSSHPRCAVPAPRDLAAGG